MESPRHVQIAETRGTATEMFHLLRFIPRFAASPPCQKSRILSPKSTDKKWVKTTSTNIHRLSASSGWRLLGEAAAMYGGRSGSAEVPPYRPLAGTSADLDGPPRMLMRGFGLSYARIQLLGSSVGRQSAGKSLSVTCKSSFFFLIILMYSSAC